MSRFYCKSYRRLVVGAGLAGSAWHPAAGQSFNIIGLAPARHTLIAPRSIQVEATFSQAIQPGPASLGALKVFSNQRGGQQVGTTTVHNQTMQFAAGRSFVPGEVVSVTLTTAAHSSAGVALAHPLVYQFTTSVVGGTGIFGGGSEVPVATGSSTYPYAVATADVDGDGDLDLLTANGFSATSGTVSIRFNDGHGMFGGGSEVSVGTIPFNVVTADVDGDGDLDLLTASYNGATAGTVSIRLNAGNGTFAGGSQVAVGNYPARLAVGDLDGDGDLDLLTANASGNSNSVSVRFNAGNGTFSGNTEVAVGQVPVSVTVGDVDGDGDLDLLTANDGNTVSVRLNNGQGGFGGSTEVPVSAGLVREVLVGDVDGDGDLDLLTSNGIYYGTVSVRLNNGAGQFSGGSNFSIGTNPDRMSIADVDGDGDLDLLVANYGDNAVAVRLNNGAGTFSGSTSVPVGNRPGSVATADIDGDGDLDFLSCYQGNLGQNDYGVSVRFNNGTGAPLAVHRAYASTASFHLYPNPAHETTHIDLLRDATTIQLVDMLGRVLRSWSVPAGTVDTSLPLGDLPAGLYFVRAGATTHPLRIE